MVEVTFRQYHPNDETSQSLDEPFELRSDGMRATHVTFMLPPELNGDWTIDCFRPLTGRSLVGLRTSGIGKSMKSEVIKTVLLWSALCT